MVVVMCGCCVVRIVAPSHAALMPAINREGFVPRKHVPAPLGRFDPKEDGKVTSIILTLYTNYTIKLVCWALTPP